MQAKCREGPGQARREMASRREDVGRVPDPHGRREARAHPRRMGAGVAQKGHARVQGQCRRGAVVVQG